MKAGKRAPQVGRLIAEAIEHHAAGRLADAAERYASVVQTKPAHGEAWRLWGVIALQSGELCAARDRLERAIRLDARDAAALSALGTVDELEGKAQAAHAAYSAARRIDPQLEPACIGLTRVALALGRVDEAIAVGTAAAARGVRDPGLLSALGAARTSIRDYAGAAEALEGALRIRPHASTYAYLAGVYLHLHRADAALAACEHALALEPSHALATLHRGIAHYFGGAYPAAVAAMERAVALGCEAAHLHLGSLHLQLGDYRAGWPHFGWDVAARRALPVFSRLPMWDGTPAAAKRLLLWHEQGIGDTILLARFIREARSRVGAVTLACPPGTAGLFRKVDGIDAVVGMDSAGLDSYDCWLPTVRLPVVFAVTPQSIPVEPYLHAEPERVERFRSRLNAPGCLRVGLVWAGNPDHQWDDARSCRLADFASLAAIEGVRWFALQQGAARAEQDHSPLPLVAINADVTDFADTAAIIAQLDLVISVDTSVANLAAALGRPVWVLLNNPSDWRWSRTGESSPWYPTARLFRQREDRAWAPVIDDIAAAFHRLLRERVRGPSPEWSDPQQS